jgi:tetratricopeptide (TPR) repeat protein
LIRDVAYGRLPRAVRSRLHHGTASWLDTSGDESAGAQVDLRASHAARALELARAAALDEDVPDLEAAAMRAFVSAGDRQVSLDAVRAASYYAEALELAPAGPERAEVRRSAASLGWRSGSMTSDEALEQYRLAEREATEAGDERLAARVLRRIYYLLGLRGDTAGAHDALARAIGLVEHDPEAIEELAELYACRAEAEMFAGRSDESRRWADRALELARTQTVSLMALHLRGNARCETGDLGGVDDLRLALAIAEESGVAIDIVTSSSYLLEWVGLEDGPSVGLPMNRATIDLCHRRGIEGQGMWSRAEGLWLRFDAGLWSEVLAETEALVAWASAHGDAQIATVADLYRARVLAHQGEIETAVALADGAVSAARQIEDLQVLAPALMVAIVAAAAAGEHRRAIELAEEFDEATGEGPTEYRELYLPEIVRALLAAGSRELAARIVGDRPVHVRRTRLAVASCRAELAAGHEDTVATARMFREAAAGWEAWGGRFEQAHALMGLGRAASGDSRHEAEEAAAAAAEIFQQLGVRQHD